jgi:hypothetical protein
MMKTALSIIQAARRRMSLSAPTTLVSVTDPDELQMIQLFYAVCEELRQARCWPQLKRYHSFATVDTVASYALPQDFYAPLLKTHHNESEDNRLLGPASDALYRNMTVLGDSSINYTYRIWGRDENTASSGGQMELLPTPSSVKTISFEYISRSFLLPKNWAAATAYTVGTYVNANGNIYLCDTDGTSHAATAPSGRTQNIDDGTTRWDYVAAAYETILADTDLCVFDDDLVKLGLRAKWIEEKGGDYTAAKDEFQTRLDQAVARYRGSYVGSMGQRRGGPLYTVPNRTWSI